jgi:hypothetical protein
MYTGPIQDSTAVSFVVTCQTVCNSNSVKDKNLKFQRNIKGGTRRDTTLMQMFREAKIKKSVNGSIQELITTG